MIYSELLHQYEDEIKESIEELFSTAFKKQTFPTDLLMTISNGYFDNNIKQQFPNTTGFMIGAGPKMEEFTEIAQYKFYHNYRKNFVDAHRIMFNLDSKNQFLEQVKSNKEMEEFEELSIQLELIIYLKLWESDLFIKRLCQLAALAQGRPYEWNFKLKDTSELVHNKLSNLDSKLPNFSQFISKNYYRDLRNAIAHSQFFFLARKINVTNIKAPPLSFDDWEPIFHKLLLFYNFYIGEIKKYQQIYIEKSTEKGYLQIRTPLPKEKGKEVQYQVSKIEYFERGKRWTFHQDD